MQQKVRAIFMWMNNNIQYDYVGLAIGKVNAWFFGFYKIWKIIYIYGKIEIQSTKAFLTTNS